MISHGFYRWVDGEGSLRPYQFYRVILGFMLWRHAWVFLDNHIRTGFYQDRFFYPYFSWWPQPNEPIYISLLLLIIIAGGFLMLNKASRLFAIMSFVLVGYHLMLNQFWYRHNRYFLFLLLLLLAIGPLGSLFRSQVNSVGKTWSFFLIRLQMSFTYLASAIAKTFDEDWRSGNVLQARIDSVLQGKGAIGGEVLPDFGSEWIIRILSIEYFGPLVTFLALIQEYFLAICLWLPQTRLLAIWVGVIFHGSIEVSSHVLVFSYAALATYFVVIEPTRENREFVFNPNIKLQMRIARIAQSLDWLNKVKFSTAETEHFILIERNNKIYTGLSALSVLGNCLVIPFLITYPISWFKKKSNIELPEKRAAFYQNGGSSIKTSWLLTICIISFTLYHLLALLGSLDVIELTIRNLRFVDLMLIFALFVAVNKLSFSQEKALET